jgi:hypothetical protein
VDTSALVAYTKAFFGIANVVMLPHIEIEQEKKSTYWREQGDKYRYALESRVHASSGRRQLQVNPILSMLQKSRTSAKWQAAHPDAFCIMAITMVKPSVSLSHLIQFRSQVCMIP